MSQHSRCPGRAGTSLRDQSLHQQDFLSGCCCCNRGQILLPIQDICNMEIGCWASSANGSATDALEAIIRPLRASAARPPLPLRCALARTLNNPCYCEATFQLPAFLLSPARPVVRGRVVLLSHCLISASRHGPQGFSLSGSPLGLCWEVPIVRHRRATSLARPTN
jgi:hypothetical protein